MNYRDERCDQKIRWKLTGMQAEQPLFRNYSDVTSQQDVFIACAYRQHAVLIVVVRQRIRAVWVCVLLNRAQLDNFKCVPTSHDLVAEKLLLLTPRKHSLQRGKLVTVFTAQVEKAAFGADDARAQRHAFEPHFGMAV